MYKSALSTSLPDLPSLSKPSQTTPRKFEKLSYKKHIHENEVAPPPGATIHPVAAISPVGGPRLPSIKTSLRTRKNRRSVDSDIFNIYNTTRHTVEYYEHHGNIYVSDGERPWKEDCACKSCDKNKSEWLERHRKGAELKQRRLKKTLLGSKTTPVKELKEET